MRWLCSATFFVVNSPTVCLPFIRFLGGTDPPSPDDEPLSPEESRSEESLSESSLDEFLPFPSASSESSSELSAGYDVVPDAVSALSVELGRSEESLGRFEACNSSLARLLCPDCCDARAPSLFSLSLRASSYPFRNELRKPINMLPASSSSFDRGLVGCFRVVSLLGSTGAGAFSVAVGAATAGGRGATSTRLALPVCRGGVCSAGAAAGEAGAAVPPEDC